MYIFLFIFLTVGTAFSQDSGVYVSLNNPAKNRGLVVIMGAAAKDAYGLLKVPVVVKKVVSCEIGNRTPVETTIEMKKGISINCEHEVDTDSYTCYHTFNAQDGGPADKAVETLNFPCGK